MGYQYNLEYEFAVGNPHENNSHYFRVMTEHFYFPNPVSIGEKILIRSLTFKVDDILHNPESDDSYLQINNYNYPDLEAARKDYERVTRELSDIIKTKELV